MKHLLKNDCKYFEKDIIESLKKKHKFSQGRHIEMLLWDYEILCQLLEYSPDFILKGGAAAQVYLPENIQRASRDIDIATTLPVEDIENVLNKIKEKFSSYVESKEHFTWTKSTMNNDNKKKIEDLHVYNLIIPTKIDLAPLQKDFSYLKLDIIRYKKMPFKIKDVSNPTVLGCVFKPLKIISEGSLIADKLLTLGDKTTGILAIDKNIEGFFKQVYDLTKLIDNFITNKEVLDDLFNTLEKLTPIEIGYRKLNVSLIEVFEDIEKSLGDKLEFDFKTDDFSKDLKERVKGFRSEYLNKDEDVSLGTWTSRLGKLKFITSLCIEKFKTNKTINDIQEKIEKVLEIEKNLKSLKGDKIKKVRDVLMKHSKEKSQFYRALKNSLPERIFYHVVNLENMDKIDLEVKEL